MPEFTAPLRDLLFDVQSAIAAEGFAWRPGEVHLDLLAAGETIKLDPPPPNTASTVPVNLPGDVPRIVVGWWRNRALETFTVGPGQLDLVAERMQGHRPR